jgi:hypothetical protein
VEGRPATSLPLDQWVSFEIEATLGKTVGRMWSLRVAGASVDMALDKLAFQDADFHELDWVAFISNAQQRTSAYLDNLRIVNQRPDESHTP